MYYTGIMFFTYEAIEDIGISSLQSQYIRVFVKQNFDFRATRIQTLFDLYFILFVIVLLNYLHFQTFFIRIFFFFS